VIDVDARHVGLTVDGQVVLVRKEDGTINATQIVQLAYTRPEEWNAALTRFETAKEMVRKKV